MKRTEIGEKRQENNQDLQLWINQIAPAKF
jgi:hypothetical protein